MKILQIIPAQPGWNVVFKTGQRKWSPAHDEAGGIEFVPVACWALVRDDASGACRVLPMSGGERGAALVPLDPENEEALGVSPPGRRPRDWVAATKISGDTTRRITPAEKAAAAGKAGTPGGSADPAGSADPDATTETDPPSVAAVPRPFPPGLAEAPTLEGGWKFKHLKDGSPASDDGETKVEPSEQSWKLRELEQDGEGESSKADGSSDELESLEELKAGSRQISISELLDASPGDGQGPTNVPGGDVLDLDF